MVRQAFIEEVSSVPSRTLTTIGDRDGNEQDSTVTSSSSLTKLVHQDGGCSDDEVIVSSSASSVSGEDIALDTMIDVLESERPMIKFDSESVQERNMDHNGEKNQNELSTGHSVEYWTVGSNKKRKNLIKKFPMSNQIGNEAPIPMMHPNEMFSTANAAAALPNHQQFNGYGYYNGPQFFQPTSQMETAQFHQYNQNYGQSQFMTVVPPQPMQIFIPPDQRVMQSTGQFVPASQQSHIMPPAAPATYYQNCYGVPMPTMPMSAVSYYQGAPMFYQTAVPQVAPAFQPVYNNLSLPEYSLGGGYARHAAYLEANRINEINLSAQSSPRVSENEASTEVSEGSMEQGQSCVGVEQNSTKCEADTTIMDGGMNTSSASSTSFANSNGNGMALDDSWHLPNFLVPSSPSCSVVSSLSDTDLSGMLVGTQVNSGAVLDENASVTSGYSSAPSTPTSRSLAPGYFSETNLNGGGFANQQSLVAVTDSFDAQMNYSGFGGDEMANQALCSTVGTGMHDYEQYALQLRAINDARMGNILVQDIVAVPSANSQDYVYPGERVILLYSDAEGCGSVIMYNSEAVPYVANTFDLNVQSNLSLQSGGSKCFRYFVPPRTLDNDYFGGQMTMWQVKMVHYFLKYHPHTWKMHGVPETFDIGTFLANTMSIVGEFHIVSKLRFCCRACKTPWTSKKGTIVFKFCFNSTTNRGWILMRIFGQICIKKECSDWTFQNPACYPEEIDRAMNKLSEYIGLHVYGIAVKPNCFADCFKSIRKTGGSGGCNKAGNGHPTPHKSEFCQACMNGVCKNLFIPALTSTAPKASQTSHSMQMQLEEPVKS
ncbi:unnamed protein product [Orchesella dallaii]|uniref:3CxxC-type domain-containing protein n=1 Tax=Orchesella dallaii TaxID=48710 RepID=A0ABP1R9D6_9HEXA